MRTSFLTVFLLNITSITCYSASADHKDLRYYIRHAALPTAAPIAKTEAPPAKRAAKGSAAKPDIRNYFQPAAPRAATASAAAPALAPAPIEPAALAAAAPAAARVLKILTDGKEFPSTTQAYDITDLNLTDLNASMTCHAVECLSPIHAGEDAGALLDTSGSMPTRDPSKSSAQTASAAPAASSAAAAASADNNQQITGQKRKLQAIGQ